MEKNKKQLIWNHLTLAIIGLIYVVVLTIIFGSCCPLYILTKINCPFCGMTRAHIALFNMNFTMAFRYHPLFLLGLPYLFLLLHKNINFFQTNKKAKLIRKILLIIVSAAICIIYIIRIITSGFSFIEFFSLL